MTFVGDMKSTDDDLKYQLAGVFLVAWQLVSAVGQS